MLPMLKFTTVPVGPLARSEAAKTAMLASSVHSLLIASVDLRYLGGSAREHDVLGNTFDGCQVAPGEKEIGPSAAKAPATAPPIAPPAP
jgi:hypothetical protein